MTDGNISMEEDTELRDLVVQTLESNGVLAKIRAELRASVFLALEEQESVMNPEPLLNKTVKQYLSNSEGKLLFSLVREFLEYFGLEYTMSVYDPETYFGKEYNYIGRNKLCEELGITSTEPLLGEILKSGVNIALHGVRKGTSSDGEREVSLETNPANVTYDLSVPKTMHDRSESFLRETISCDGTERVDRFEIGGPTSSGIVNEERSDIPLRSNGTSVEPRADVPGTIQGNRDDTCAYEALSKDKDRDAVRRLSDANDLDRSAYCNIEVSNERDDRAFSETQGDRGQVVSRRNNMKNLESVFANNAQNKRLAGRESNCGKTIYFEEIIVDGRRESIDAVRASEPFLTNVTDTLDERMSGSIFDDLPPLNGKRAIERHDLRELMDIGLATDDVDNYEEDFASSASASTSERSPCKNAVDELLASPRRMSVPSTGPEAEVPHVHNEDACEVIEETDEIVDDVSCVSIDVGPAEVIGADRETTLAAGIAVKCAKCV